MASLSLIRCICQLNNAIKANRKFVLVPYSLKVVSFLNIMYKSGLIQNYGFFDSNCLLVYLKYFENRPLFFKINIYKGFLSKHKFMKSACSKSKMIFLISSSTEGFYFSDQLSQLSGKIIASLSF